MLPVTAVMIRRYHVNLTDQTVRFETVPAEDLEDALGGIARATKLLIDVEVDDPYAPSAPLVMNLGLLSGTRVMTGLRTFFHGYSPLKVSDSGAPGLMWSAGSGHFGTKLRGLGIDEVIFTGRADRPTLIHLTPGADERTGPVRVPRRLRSRRTHDQRSYPGAPWALSRGALRIHRARGRALRDRALRRHRSVDGQPVGERRSQTAVLRAWRLRRRDGLEESVGDRSRRPGSCPRTRPA